MASEADPSQRPYHHGDLEHALVEAAITLIRQSGPARLSLRAIARTAGVSHTAPYHHFRDRRALLAKVCEYGLRMLQTAMRQAMDRHPDDPLRQVQASGVAYVLFAMKEPQLFRLIFRTEEASNQKYPALRKQAQETFGIHRKAVTRLAEERIPRASAEEVETAVVATWSLAHGFAQLAIDGQFGKRVKDVERAATQVTSLFLTGLISRTAGTTLTE